MTKLRWLSRIIFLIVFVGPLVFAPCASGVLGATFGVQAQQAATFEYNQANSEAGAVCAGAHQCFVACGWSGCCDYCALGSYELAFYCAWNCWVGYEGCCQPD
jgi:hypothetical protein